MEERIRKAIAEALKELGAGETAFTVERPPEMARGDYATNAALAAAKALGRSPREIAEVLAKAILSKFKKLGDDDTKVEVAGAGFVNITLSPECVRKALEEALTEKWGKGSTKKGERVMVEYSNPNPYKEMHIGHMMGTIIGEAISRLIENEGATVARDTFGGDVGPHVAKTLWALRTQGVVELANVKEIGEAYIEGSRAYEDDPKAKEEIDALNKAIYAGRDQELMSLWTRGREISMQEFRRLWRLLGTKMDFEFFDSDTTEGGIRIVKDGLTKGIFKMSDGAVIYDGEAEGVHTMVFITSHDTPTYEAKDIGFAFLKEERWPHDRMVIITGNEQSGRFKTVLAALSKIAPQLAAKIQHVPHGHLRLTSGKMSSREGNVITAAGLIADVIEKAGEKNADSLIAEQVAIGAIKYMILRQAPGSDIIFDEEKSLSLEGDSGPYLQYALVRARSVLEKARSTKHEARNETPAQPYPLERLIIHYPEVAARTARELAPNLLVNYLTELASAWNAFYAKEQVLGSPEEAYKQRVARAFAQTMTNGLALLGIPAPEKM